MIMIEKQRIFSVNGRMCGAFLAFQKTFAHCLTTFLLYRFGVILGYLSSCNGREYQSPYSMTTNNEQRQVFCFGAVFALIYLLLK